MAAVPAARRWWYPSEPERRVSDSSSLSRWMTRSGLFFLAAVLALGMWMTPRVLYELRNRSDSGGSLVVPLLPEEVAVPGENVRVDARLVPPSERPRDVLPLHFTPESAQTVLAGLTREGTLADGDLPLWDKILLGRLLAIDEITADRSSYYETDYLGLLLAFAAESLLDPLAQGPQVDDRGLGQVGFWMEAEGRRWLSDPHSLYYRPGFNATASIWEPETNITLAAAMSRWVYTSPEIKDPLTGYAVYTRGHIALLSGGRLESEAQVRLERADSYRERMLNFLRLKLGIGAESEDAIVRGIVAIDRTEPDGRQTYRALRDLYMEYLEEPDSLYAAVLLSREALTFTDLLNDIYGESQRAEYEELLGVLRVLATSVSPATVGGASADFTQTLARLESRVAR